MAADLGRKLLRVDLLQIVPAVAPRALFRRAESTSAITTDAGISA